jgi:hypothetical protein
MYSTKPFKPSLRKTGMLFGMLAVRTGYRNDEGTAAILFQKTRYFTIGRQGGITLTNGKGKRSRPVKGLRNIACTELKY